MNHGPQHNIYNIFFPDIFKEICTYLDQQDIENLKVVCKSLYTHMNDAQMDVVWQPLLNRLKAIDRNLEITNSSGQTDAWRAPLFKDLFNQVLSNLRNEVLHHINLYNVEASPILQELKAFDIANRKHMKLSKLEKINELLEEFKQSLKDNLGSEFNLRITRANNNPGFTPLQQALRSENPNPFHLILNLIPQDAVRNFLRNTVQTRDDFEQNNERNQRPGN